MTSLSGGFHAEQSCYSAAQHSIVRRVDNGLGLLLELRAERTPPQTRSRPRGRTGGRNSTTKEGARRRSTSGSSGKLPRRRAGRRRRGRAPLLDTLTSPPCLTGALKSWTRWKNHPACHCLCMNAFNPSGMFQRERLLEGVSGVLPRESAACILAASKLAAQGNMAQGQTL